jgi:O-antigen ligase
VLVAELYKIRYLVIIELSLLIVFAVFDYIPFLILLSLIFLIPILYLIFINPIIGTHLLMFSILVGSLGVVKVSGKTPSILVVDIIFLIIISIFIIKVLTNIDKEMKIPVVILLWLPFLIWGLLSFFVAIEKFRALAMWKNYFAGFVALSYTYFAIKNKIHVKIVLIGIIIWGLLLSIIEFKILMIDLGGLSGGIVGLYFKKNLLATSWGRSNYLATFFVMIIPITIGYLLYVKSNKGKFLLLISIMLMSSALVLTLSRGGLLSLSLAIFLFFSRVIKGKTLIPVFLAFLIVGVVVLLNPLTYVLIERTAAVEGSSSFLTRINFYEDVWKTFSKNPIVGVGFANLGLYAQFVIPLSDTTSAHNIILGMLGETGIVGAALFFSVIGKLAWELLKSVNSEKAEDIKILKWACFSTFVGVFIHSLMEPNFEGMQFSVMFWSFIAACLKLDLLKNIR